MKKPSPFNKLTRRQFLGTIPMVVLISGQKQYSLVNETLAFQITAGKDIRYSRTFENRLTGRSIPLPAEEFLLTFDNGKKISSDGMEVKTSGAGNRMIELLFSDDTGLGVRVRYSLLPGAHYLRKQISVRQKGSQRKRLFSVNLENWQGVKYGWDSIHHADPVPFGSYPVYCDDLWAGVEFVAAFNEHNSEGFILRSRPGGIYLGNDWFDLHSTVVGVAKTGNVRNSFLNYIEDIRLAPPRMAACYNSWWTLPKVVKQKDNLDLIKELKSGMFDENNVFFDIITTDMGWSKPQSIWEIDPSILPQGFDDIRGIVEPAGGKLGLWMSPSEIYPPVCDYVWADKNGYKVLPQDPKKPDGPIRGISLADHKYRSETKAQLKKLITENNLAHIKYDGFTAIEYEGHHDLLPGDDSVEPLASYSLELLQVSKEANPDLITEPTCMNSFYNYISPWIIKYSDTIWGNATDSVIGIGPAPDYRESHTNGREYMIFKSLDQIWLPQNALQYFDITHVDEYEGFPNHAAIAFGRGRFFISTYLNPKLMSKEDWRIYSGLLKWARKNSGILRNTVVIPSRVESGESYVYAHWLGTRGIIMVRNPNNENTDFVLDLDKTGAPAELVDAVCYSQFPCRKGITSGVNGKSSISLNLAPWEVLFLEIVPNSELKEPVAIGARWFRESDGSMSVVPDKSVANVMMYEPGKPPQMVSVKNGEKESLKGEVISVEMNEVPEDQWLTGKQRIFALYPFKYPLDKTPETIEKLKETGWKNAIWKKVPTSRFEVRCSVSIPRESSGKVLLLVEFPGRDQSPSTCEVWVDGNKVDPEIKSSEGHIGYHVPGGSLRPFETEWCWYICSIPGGSHNIEFKGMSGHPKTKLGLWLWSDDDLTQVAQRTSVNCSIPAMPQYRDRVDRKGICLLKPKVL